MATAEIHLKTGDSPFTADPAQSFTLPARFYTDESVYALEQEAIFYNSWWYAGHVSQLQKTGDYLTTEIHEQSVFVVRDRIVCPYHAWSYDLDGQLKGARNTENMEGFKKCDFALKPVQVEVLCGLVMINLNLQAKPLKELAPGLEDEIKQYCPSVDNLVFAQRDTYEVPCNWKVMIDNFLECYHCHTAHRDFVDLVDMDSYRSKVNGIYSSHVSQAVKSTNNKAYKFEKGDVDFGYAGWFLWPNLTIWAYPGEANLSVLQMKPDGVEHTVEFQDWFAKSATPGSQLKDAMDYQKDVLQPEDIGLCVSVQKGLKSRGYNQGRFVVDNERSELSEHAVHHFQNMVADALNAKPAAQTPRLLFGLFLQPDCG